MYICVYVIFNYIKFIINMKTSSLKYICIIHNICYLATCLKKIPDKVLLQCTILRNSLSYLEKINSYVVIAN